jgi:hypothetical protein
MGAAIAGGIMGLTTLGEALFGVKSNKPVGTTCEKFAGRKFREPCGCGRGFIEYEYRSDGSRFSWYRVCTWGKDLSGNLEFADCCKQCAEDEQHELDMEALESGWNDLK